METITTSTTWRCLLIMKNLFILIFVLISTIGLSQTIRYDYQSREFFLVNDTVNEIIISNDWSSWGKPGRISTLTPEKLNVREINRSNEYYNLGVILYNEGVNCFQEADRTNNSNEFKDLIEHYTFYWMMSANFFERDYQLKRSKETIKALKLVYARLNDVKNFKRIEDISQ